jgi:thiol-disulfide isomerase/thioredoxin
MPNCALAYTLQYYKDDDNLWEKIALLNLLNFKAFGKYKSLVPSFDKMALKMFGGTMDIEEYRSHLSNDDKTYSIEFPPCNTIIPMLEEIYKKNNLSNTFIPLDKQITNMNISNDLKLKRSKPIINHKNTLDFCLGKSKL